jgi:hypothetical protein
MESDPELDPDPEPEPESDPETVSDSLVRGTDPGIRIRIPTKMSRIPNTTLYSKLLVCFLEPLSSSVHMRTDDNTEYTHVINEWGILAVQKVGCVVPLSDATETTG